MVKVLDVEVRLKGDELDFLLYTLKDNGIEYYRAVRLLRLLRNPREYAQIETALEIHRDVVSTTRVLPNARLILIAVNSKRTGLIWSYGVAVTSLKKDYTIKLSKECFVALMSSFRGSYRQAIIRPLNRDEVYEFLRLSNSRYGITIFGIPEPRDSYSRSLRELGFKVGIRVIEMIEEIIRGLMDKEFLYTVIAEAVDPRKLTAMLTRVADLATKYSDFQENTSIGFGVSIPIGFDMGQSINQSIGSSENRNISKATSRSITTSSLTSRSSTKSHSTTSTVGTSRTSGITNSTSIANTNSISRTKGITRTISQAYTKSHTLSNSKSSSITKGVSNSRGYGITSGRSNVKGAMITNSASKSKNFRGNLGISIIGVGGGYNWGNSRSVSTPDPSLGYYTVQKSSSTQKSTMNTATRGTTITKGSSYTISNSHGSSVSVANSRTLGTSSSITKGISVNRSKTSSHSFSRSKGYSSSLGVTRGISKTNGTINGIGLGESRQQGLSLASSEGIIAGVWPSISYGFSRIRSDEVRRIAYKVLSIEESRYMEMVAQGGFYSQVVLMAPERDTVLSAKALIVGAYSPTRLVPHPLSVLNADYELLKNASSFSFDMRRKRNLLEPHRFINIYTSTELASLTHPPRLEAPGIENVVENIPEFRVPGPRSYDVEFGNVISHETGEVTRIRYGIDIDELLHALFLGITRSGKTNAAMIFVSRLLRLGARALVLDWKKDWRRLLRVCRPARFFTLYSFNPIRFNPLRPPSGVDVETWRDLATLWFALSYGLGPRSYSLLWAKLDELYERNGIYDGSSEYPTLDELYSSIKDEMVNKGRHTSLNELDVYIKVLDRLKFYTRGKFKRLFSSKKSIDISSLLKSGVTIIEAGELADIHKPFLLGLLAISSFFYRKFNYPSEIPELIVMEEAHQIAFDVSQNGTARMLNITEGIFDKIASESAGYNQYLVMIAQYPSILGDGVRKNTGLLVTFKLVSEAFRREDVTRITEMLARDSRLDHRNVKRFLTRLPIGWSIVRKMRTYDLIDTEPVLVKWDLLKVKPPSDEEL